MNAKDYPYCATAFAAMAHRGGSAWEPNLGRENTAYAFSQAVSLGYRYIETDLQATRDGRLVCLHDPTLERMTGTAGKVSDFLADDLRSLRIAGSEPIPFFDEVVEAFPDTRFNVDLKTEGAIEPLIAAIRSHRLQDRILVDTFSQHRLTRFRRLAGDAIPTAMGPAGVLRTVVIPPAGRILTSPGMALQGPVSGKLGPVTIPVATAQTVDRVHRLGKVIHVWTVDDPQEMERLIDLGVDGIITDRPDLLKQVLLRRNLWETG